MNNLNAKQHKAILSAIREGKKEGKILQQLEWFDVEKGNQGKLYELLSEEAAGAQFDQLDPNFIGLGYATKENLNDIIARGWMGDWKIDLERAAQYSKLRIHSMEDRGLYIDATIDTIEELDNGKKRVHFDSCNLCRHWHSNVKFDRNVFSYIN